MRLPVPGLLVCLLLLAAVGYLGLVWRHGRRLHAAGEMIDQFWRGLEEVLVRHHRAAEDLVRQADAHGLLPDGERERAESAVAFATMTGSPSQRAHREGQLHEAMRAVSDSVTPAASERSVDGGTAAPSRCLTTTVRDYEAAWLDVRTVGRRYSELAGQYNRLVSSPFHVLWNRRLGRRPAQSFTPEDPGTRHVVDVL